MRVIKKSYKYLLIVAILFVLYAVGQNYVNHFIHTELPKIITEKNNTPYNLKYGKVEYSLALRKLTIKDIELTPHQILKDKQATRIEGNISSIFIQGVEIWTLLKQHNLIANRIELDRPYITVWKSESDSIQENQSTKLTAGIDISKIKVNHADVVIKSLKGGHIINQIYNFSSKVEGVHFGQETKDKPIPFTYTSYSMSSDSVYNRLNDRHSLTIGKVNITTTDIQADSIRIKPLQKSHEHIDAINENILLLKIPTLHLSKVDWGYKNMDEFYVTIDEINTKSAKFGLLNKKQKTDKKEQTELETALPKLVPFDLSINKIAIEDFAFNSLDAWKSEHTNIKIKSIVNKVNDTLHIGSIAVDNAEVTHIPQRKLITPKAKGKKILDIVKIDSLTVSNTNFVIKENNNKQNKLSVDSVSAVIKDIYITPLTAVNKLPFAYGETQFKTRKVNFDSGKYYQIEMDNIAISNHTMSFNNFVMNPKMSRKQMVKTFKYADDIFRLKAKEISLTDYEWGFDEKGVVFFNTKLLQLDQLNANIYRDKIPPHNMSNKSMFSKKLRDINFGLRIDEVRIRKSHLVYEESDAKAVAPGKITLGNFTANIKNLASGYNKKKLPLTTISVDANFMNAAPLHVDWSFNILNRADKFNIKGTVKNFPATAMQPFLQPYVKASTDGKLELVQFNFSGDAKVATGTFGMKYQNLRVTIYRKDGKAKKKVLSALGNLIIRDNSKGELKTVNIKKVQKVEEKSFFNYLWLCILQGLKQTIL
ncbi:MULTISPECIES: DUF748 domain-containing protein [Myroides]|uniref:DUF748 domain-containing protein n=1 Tax=Myroides albus TaxID=2562892 RepID=A0A6I3LEM8_9FLAO|nr:MULTISPECIES: DUF748 domain-containing protein [Myroides]MTG96928.1 DUF748 domain-containing protein [Myroides albus]MVX35379.1 DUF748 domain-containing protein [Myroides sp. LoEW2-1]UVD78321.1 DUF748 domain-containing protein [Myroides albus]